MTTPYGSGGAHVAGADEGGRPDVDNVSVGALISEVTKDFSTLMRQELALAKAEMKVEAAKAGKGAGMLGAAGLAGYFLLLFLSLALMWAIGDLLGHIAWGALVVALLWGIAAAVLASMGRKKLQQVNPKPERTVETLQEVPDALKGR
ncbi:MAG: phage holin family protein [Actinomycetota bacterium]|nr:phage holin family protein [Actinomycetota bacterium]